jgi:hypothetical protein
MKAASIPEQRTHFQKRIPNVENTFVVGFSLSYRNTVATSDFRKTYVSDNTSDVRETTPDGSLNSGRNGQQIQFFARIKLTVIILRYLY